MCKILSFATGDFVVEICQMESGLIRTRLRSRHSESVKYKTVVKYCPVLYSNTQGQQTPPNSRNSSNIQGWYCTCKVGSRTIGMCAHAASIVWYFGLGWNKRELSPRGVDLEAIFVVSSGESDSDEE